MSLKVQLQRAVELGPTEATKRAVSIVGRDVAGLIARVRNSRIPSRSGDQEIPRGQLWRIGELPPVAVLTTEAESVLVIGECWLKHHFDLLGSGWSSVAYGTQCRGIEGHRFAAGARANPDPAGDWLAAVVRRADLNESKRVWNLIEGDYAPIDWQLDFKSGYRWRPKADSRLLRYGHVVGADVKVPWELARLQHLPTLAFAYRLANSGVEGFMPPDRYLAEFRNQVLDFAATNPPGHGVNWRCTMDVGIRIANQIVAWSLFDSTGVQFDSAFDEVYRKSLLDHGRHIAANLEWRSELRSNHYLSDIVGLLFVAIHLPKSPETDAWLAFGTQELVAETGLQFHEDGSNFEGSTAYHRLSGELALWGTAVVLGMDADRYRAFDSFDPSFISSGPEQQEESVRLHPLPERSTTKGDVRHTPFPPSHFSRLTGVIEFARAVTRPDGAIVQFGDNDSGRLFKLSRKFEMLTPAAASELFANLDGWTPPSEMKQIPIENHLANDELIGCGEVLFGNRRISGESVSWEGATIAVFASVVSEVRVERSEKSGAPALISAATAPPPIPEGAHIYRFEASPGLCDDLEHLQFPGMGLYVMRSERLYVAVRCGEVGQNGNGGHAHNDQLAIELVIDGEVLVRDPGTYLYTPLVDRRNEYRSAAAHFAPRIEGREPGDISAGTFRLKDRAHARCDFFHDGVFVGTHTGYGAGIWRQVKACDDGVVVTDWYEGPGELAAWEPPPFSPGYGLRARLADQAPLRSEELR